MSKEIPPASLFQILETAYDVTTPHEKDWISDSVVSFMANAGLTEDSTDRFGNDIGDTVQAALLVAALLSPQLAEHLNKLERVGSAVARLPVYEPGWSRRTDEARRETFNAAKNALISHRQLAKRNPEHDTNTCEVCADLRREMDANRGAVADGEWVCPRTFNKLPHLPHRVPFGPKDEPFECPGYTDPGDIDTYSFNPSNHKDTRTTCGCACHSYPRAGVSECGRCGYVKDLDMIEAVKARNVRRAQELLAIKSGIDTVNHDAASLEEL